MHTKTLIDGATSTGVGDSFPISNPAPASFQCEVAGTGSVTATVAVEVSADNSTWDTAITFELDGTTSDSDGAPQNPILWPFVRGNVTAISGTGAAVTLKMGV